MRAVERIANPRAVLQNVEGNVSVELDAGVPARGFLERKVEPCAVDARAASPVRSWRGQVDCPRFSVGLALLPGGAR